MENKNFYRQFNVPVKKHIDWKTIGVKILLVFVVFELSLISYYFWDAIAMLIGR